MSKRHDVVRQAKRAVAREKTRKQPLDKPLVATMKEELEAKGTPIEKVEAALMREPPPAEEHPGLVRAVAGRAFSAARFLFGLAGRVMQFPLLVIDQLRHHDRMKHA